MENENNFGLSAEDRAALEEMKRIKAEQAKQEELNKSRTAQREGILSDEGTKILYESYGLKEEIDADESILDSPAAMKLAIRGAKSKFEAEMAANKQKQNQTPETVPSQDSEPARPQSGVSSSLTNEEYVTPAKETVESIAKKTGLSNGVAALAKAFNRNYATD